MTTATSLSQARRRAVLTSIAGNALEFYDTVIYAFFAIYFAGHFFPSHNALVSQISAYTVFGLSFFARPIGGILISIYADKIGRKPLLVSTTIAMALSTGVIGLLPTYEQIGIWAPVLLVLARLIQAIAVGGVFSSTTAFLMEFAPAHRRGFYASAQMLAQSISPILANLVALVLLYTIGKQAIGDYGWRIPFLIGLLTTPLGYYIHKFVDESPEFTEYMRRTEAKNQQTLPAQLSIGQTLKHPAYVMQIIRCMGIVMVGTVSYFGVAIYLPGFIQSTLHLADTQRFWISFLIPTFTALAVPISGYFCDKIPRARTMLIGICIYGVAFFSFFYYLSAGHASYTGALIGMSIIGFTMGLHWGVSPILMSEAYPIQIRASAVSIAYNGAVVLFGAMAPAYLSLLEEAFGKSPKNPLIYIGLSIIIGIIAVRAWRPASQLQIPKEKIQDA